MLSRAATHHYIPPGPEPLMCSAGFFVLRVYGETAAPGRQDMRLLRGFFLSRRGRPCNVSSSARLRRRPIVGVRKRYVWSAGRLVGRGVSVSDVRVKHNSTPT